MKKIPDGVWNKNNIQMGNIKLIDKTTIQVKVYVGEVICQKM